MSETEPHKREPTTWVAWLAWVTLFAAMVLVLVVFVRQGPTPELQYDGTQSHLRVYGELPDFQLINRDGEDVSLDDLSGAPWIADFMFTSCQVSCPFLTAEMARLQAALPPDGATRLVSLSVDPENDTPDVLDDYARRYQADDDWLFLTGSRDEMYRLIREGFQLGVEPGAGTAKEPIAHSTRFVLVDAQGRIRGYYESTDRAEMVQLLEDLGTLL